MSSRAKQVALVIEGARLRRLQALVGSVLLLGALLSAQQALVPKISSHLAQRQARHMALKIEA